MALWIEECVFCFDKAEEIYIHVYPNHILHFSTLYFTCAHSNFIQDWNCTFTIVRI
jgi:hypothetical protein